jgi:ketosteroid isomerase-like protein
MTGIETLETLLAAMRRGDLATAATLIHPDIIVSEPDSLPYGGVHRGKQAFFEDVLGGILRRATLQLGETTVRDAGDVIVAHMVLTFTAHDTGRSVTLPLVEIYTVDDGLITSIDVYPKDTVHYRTVFEAG